MLLSRLYNNDYIYAMQVWKKFVKEGVKSFFSRFLVFLCSSFRNVKSVPLVMLEVTSFTLDSLYCLGEVSAVKSLELKSSTMDRFNC